MEKARFYHLRHRIGCRCPINGSLFSACVCMTFSPNVKIYDQRELKIGKIWVSIRVTYSLFFGDINDVRRSSPGDTKRSD